MVENSVLLSRMCGFLDSLYKAEIKKSAKYIIWGLYIVLLAVVSYFHEPWFDEAQSWQIAKSASVYDIFFVVPHYEGHPPLWHLVLLPFAKGGMPYEFSISFVNIAFMAAGCFLLMFKTKLPDAAKITLPFTYFIFYQYGVISRPYSMMFLAFMLCALNYREKNEKPVRMALSLAFLCLTSAYGLAIAGLICVVWLFEFKDKKAFGVFVRELVKSKVFGCLAGLLMLAVLLVVMMFPTPETSAVADGRTASGVIDNMFYTYCLLPADATVGMTLMNDDAIKNYSFLQFENAGFLLISAAVILWCAVMGRKKGRLLLIALPSAIMPALYAVVFFMGHHIGITTLYLVFFACVCCDSESRCEFKKHGRAVHYFVIVGVVIFTAVQIIWSISSMVLEFNKSYAASRDTAEFIKANCTDEDFLLNNWESFVDEKTGERRHNFNISSMAVESLPYFENNIYPAFNRGSDTAAYNSHIFFDDERIAEEYEYIKSLGVPDYIIGSIHAGEEQGEYMDYIYKDYKLTAVCDVEFGKIFKGQAISAYDIIYKVEKIPD